MKLTDDPGHAQRMLTRMFAESFQDESQRHETFPHMSELIRCITKSYWIRKIGKERADKGLPPQQTESVKSLTMFAIGVGLEKAILRPSGDSSYGQYDGVYYGMDALIEEADGRLDMTEFKSTRMSVARFETDLPVNYMRQFLGYLRVHGATEGHFTVIFVIPAELRSWRSEATQEEIDKNWDWIQSRKDRLTQALELGIEPTPFAFNEDWECTNCAFKILCDAKTGRG